MAAIRHNGKEHCTGTKGLQSAVALPQRSKRAVTWRTALVALAPPLIVLAVLWLLTYGIAWGNLLVPPLENRFHATELGDPQTIAGVVVLIGNDARVQEAGLLARLYPHLKVIVSGVRASSPRAVETLLGDGIDPANITLETASSNAYTNGQQTARVLKQTSPAKRWLLITSASHMPRAIGVFRKFGITLEPWPVFDLKHILPLPDYVARYEWYGLVWYWLTGKTSAFFPAPDAVLPGAGNSNRPKLAVYSPPPHRIL